MTSRADDERSIYQRLCELAVGSGGVDAAWAVTRAGALLGNAGQAGDDAMAIFARPVEGANGTRWIARPGVVPEAELERTGRCTITSPDGKTWAHVRLLDDVLFTCIVRHPRGPDEVAALVDRLDGALARPTPGRFPN